MQSKVILYLLLATSLALGLASCTERIEVDLDNSYTRLVVDGAITTDTAQHMVKLTTTSSYYYNQQPPAVSGARVSISDGINSFELQESEPGIYRTNKDVYGVAGRTYTLEIRLKEKIGGFSEYSATSVMNTVKPLDSISLSFHPEWSRKGIWEVKCYMLEPPTVDFYRFMVSRNHTLITDTLNEWFVTDDIFFNGNYTNGATVAYLQQENPGEALFQGDTVTVEVNGITKEYAAFVSSAQSELFGSNPLFSGPPANLKSNVSNGAMGFFTAHSATRSSAIVR